MAKKPTSAKTLALIQIEMGSKYLAKLDEPLAASMAIAVYNAPVSVLRAARTDEGVLDSYVKDADEMDADAAAEVLSDFFKQWSKYQSSILTCAMEDVESMAKRVTAAKGVKSPTRVSVPTDLTETIEE